MPTQKLDLVEICRLIYKKKWFILIFAICAAAVGLVFCLVAKKEYSSRTVFIVKSPKNMDRNHIFRQGAYQPNDFFANENDIDNILTISQNEVLLQFLVDSFQLKNHYRVATPQKAFNILKKRFKVTRNDTRSLEFKIADEDPEMAAKLVNTARWETGNLFRDFFSQTKKQFVAGLQQNIARIDEQINRTNDSITNLRNQYQLFSSLLPARGKALQSQTAGGNPEKAKGLELLQKATSLKDQLIQDRAEYVSLINEYSLDTPNGGLDMFYTVQYGWPSENPSFPKIPLILAICFAAGLFFSVILTLLQAGVRHIQKTEEV